MGGRALLRRLPATAPSALAIVVLTLTLVLLPSMGPRGIAAGAVTTAAPAATLVHLLGDEVVAARPAAVRELRSRVLVPGDLLAGIVLATAVALVGLAAAGPLHARSTLARGLIALPTSSGRSPPRRARDR